MLKYIKKDLTKVRTSGIILNGVNCQRRMGSGLAKALYTKWPQVKKRYLDFPNREEQDALEVMELGAIQFIKVGKSLSVANCWTQEFYGADGKVYADLEAIETCLTKVCLVNAIFTPERSIYSPKIGCGLGGLTWKTQVLGIFEAVSERYPEQKIIVCTL